MRPPDVVGVGVRMGCGGGGGGFAVLLLARRWFVAWWRRQWRWRQGRQHRRRRWRWLWQSQLRRQNNYFGRLGISHGSCWFVESSSINGRRQRRRLRRLLELGDGGGSGVCLRGGDRRLAWLACLPWLFRRPAALMVLESSFLLSFV